LEIHQIVEFLYDDNKQLLAVTGPDMIGKNAIITRAIITNVPRHPNIEHKRVWKIELKGITLLSEVIVRIAEYLHLPSPKPTKETLLQDIPETVNEFTWIYFPRCWFLEDKDS
jgi:hypothetical protein